MESASLNLALAPTWLWPQPNNKTDTQRTTHAHTKKNKQHKAAKTVGETLYREDKCRVIEWHMVGCQVPWTRLLELTWTCPINSLYVIPARLLLYMTVVWLLPNSATKPVHFCFNWLANWKTKKKKTKKQKEISNHEIWFSIWFDAITKYPEMLSIKMSRENCALLVLLSGDQSRPTCPNPL